MVATYSTVSDVSAELGGLSITASTTITTAVVDGWLQDAEKEIELLSGQVYSTTTITSSNYEYHDYDGSGVIRLNNYPVQSIDSLEYEENGFAGTSESWVSLVGPGIVGSTNYQLYGSVGAIRFHPNTTGKSPRVGNKSVRVTYTYGHTSVPRNVKELTTKLAARRYIQAIANNSGSTGGGSISVGAISISDPTNYVINHLSRIDADIDRLQKQVVGKFRVVNYDLRLYG